MQDTIKHFLAGFLDLLLPNLCPGCTRILKDGSFPLCPKCMFYLERVDASTVRETIAKLPGNQTIFRFVFTLWLFNKAGIVQHIHRGLKYENKPYIGHAFGQLMGQTFILPIHPEERPELIIPIPLHKRRLLERGYNQSDLLARGIHTVTKIPVSKENLVRSTYTQSQTGLNKQERLNNVNNVFAASASDNVIGKHVLLVDDVLTTGATLVSAARVLHAAGATDISFITLALARL